MNIPRVDKSLLLICLLWISLAAHAEQPLSLADAIQLATQNQPLLESYRDAAISSREAAVAESQLPDLKIKFGIINLPVTTSDALSLSRDDQTMANIGFSQEMVPLKKREAAANRITAEANQFQTEQVVMTRSIERDVAFAWLDTYEAQRKSELYQRIIDDMVAERKVLATGVSSGAAKSSDVLRMDAEISLINEKRIFALRDERKARAGLARWLGTSASRFISPELPVMSKELSTQNLQQEINQHPLLINAQQTEKVAQFEVEQAKANLERNWSWEVGYGKRFAGRSDMLTFQVAIDLQLDKANRQDKRTAEKLVLVEKARKLTEDRRRELAAELENALADAQAADEREKEHLNVLIPVAKARLSLAQAAYTSGKQSLSEVWETRRNLVEVELDHWNILTDRQRAAVKLNYLLNNMNVGSPS